MARTTKVDPAEAKRRRAQSQRDKAAARSKPAAAPAAKGGKRGARKSARGVSSWKTGIHPYTKMILDPCHAQLTPTPLPGREGSSIFRLPFRYVLTLPTANTGINGGSTTASNCSAMTVLLTPSALVAGTGATALTNYSSTNENFTISTFTNGQYYSFSDPVGLSQLDQMSSLVRPVAGCVKLEFYSGTNTGSFIGYEGVAGDLIVHQGATAASPNLTSCFAPNVNNAQFAMNGWATSITTQGVEACVNYASAPQQWQEFRSLGTGQTGNATGDAGDTDYSQMPFSMVGLGGGTPGSQYLVSGAVIYEWVPTITLGTGGGSNDRPLVRDQSLLDKVAKQVSAYGPMLVGAATKLAVGGPSLAISDLLYRLSINSNNAQGSAPSGAPLRLGWK